MFDRLQTDPTAFLTPDKQNKTVANLIRLGNTMNETGDDTTLNSRIPAAYTYFGQFVNHDISLELQSDRLSNLDDSNLKPLPLSEVRRQIKNKRTAALDLDSVYGLTSDGLPVPRNCDQLAVGSVGKSGNRTPNRGPCNDLPRKPRAIGNPEI